MSEQRDTKIKNFKDALSEINFNDANTVANECNNLKKAIKAWRGNKIHKNRSKSENYLSAIENACTNVIRNDNLQHSSVLNELSEALENAGKSRLGLYIFTPVLANKKVRENLKQLSEEAGKLSKAIAQNDKKPFNNSSAPVDPDAISFTQDNYSAVMEAEEKAKRETEERAKREAEKKARREAEKKARREAEERAKREAEERAKREAEEKAKREAEERAKREAEEKAKREAEERAKREAEKKAKREAEEKAKREAEERAKREAEKKARREAEERAKREAEKKARREAEEKAKREEQVKKDEELARKLQAEKNAKSSSTQSAQKPLPVQRQELPKVTKPLIGIKNPGNACYLNSAVQQLYHMSKIRKEVLEAAKSLKEPTTFVSGNDEHKIIALSKLFHHLSGAHTLSNDEISKYDKALGYDKTQKDSGELALSLLSSLRTVQKTNTGHSIPEVIIVYKSYASPQNMIKEEVDEVSEYGTKLDTQNLTFNIAVQDKIKPDSIKESETITFKNKIIFENKNYQENVILNLVGITVHLGKTTSSGHYYVYTKSHGSWYQKNDSKVTPTNFEKIIADLKNPNCRPTVFVYKLNI